MWLLALKEHDEGGKEFLKLKEKLLETGEGVRDLAHLVQPNGVLPIHPERVGRACRDLDLVKAMDGLIETFRKTQDYYHRNQHTETVLDLRQMWNAISSETSTGPARLRNASSLSCSAMWTRACWACGTTVPFSA